MNRLITPLAGFAVVVDAAVFVVVLDVVGVGFVGLVVVGFWKKKKHTK